jgi:hypothetical protein
MRSKGRGVLAALLTIFVLGGLASASASAALPEFVPGVKESLPATFKVVGGSATWHVSGSSWVCSGLTASGTISATKTVTGTKIVFTTCFFERSGGKVWCTTKGAEKGEIRTEALEGTLVYISKAAKTVGIDFKPQSGTSLGGFNCLTGETEIRGSVVLPITSVNLRTSKFTLSATVGPTEYETESGGKATAAMESNWLGTFAPLSWQFTSNLETNKSLEIKA